MTIPYLAMLDRVMESYLMSETEPVAPETVLIRTPLSELEMEELRMRTVLTTLLERPPTEPMERPWPPLQLPPVKVMLVPELMARQSSWFLTTAPEMYTPVEEPTS